jgi:hypothetical protein
MKTMILSVADYAESGEIARAVVSSDQARAKALDTCYAIPGYADLPLEEKNRTYDKIRRV